MLENDEKKVKEENKNDELSIQNIGLSKRAVNSLDRGGIKLLNDLSNITEKDFHRIRGLGEKATNEIIDKMNEYGISFKRDTLYFEELGLSTRAVNSLESHGIKSIYELSNITKADLLEISDLGEKTVNEIIEMMKKYEISFKYENDMLYIGNIGLSAKAFNILNRQRIGLLSELSNITEEDLYTIRGIGEKIANEIIDKMKEHGISFKGESKIDKGNVSKTAEESAGIEDETESVDNDIEQQQEVQEGHKPKQEETSTNNRKELESMSAEELQKTVDENDKTIYENDQDIKKRLVERILEQQRIIAEQQKRISKLKSENKEL